MKRSEINQILRAAQALFDQYQFRLPPWAAWSPTDWKEHAGSAQEIFDCQLGWDITDFGSGDFARRGLTLFTLRNGQLGRRKKTYAEKIMVVEDGQETPAHFHFHKAEDIINRGGGILCMRLWKADKETEMLTEEPLVVSIDGVSTRVAPGETVRLAPGQSICYEPYLYHTFWAEDDHCLVGEVSTVNDDMRDNRFLTPKGRFPQIEEDVPAEHLLCNEYPEV